MSAASNSGRQKTPQNHCEESFSDVFLPMQVIAERGLQAHPSWVNKCIQLYETYLVRHGIMLVGPAGSGPPSCKECPGLEPCRRSWLNGSSS